MADSVKDTKAADIDRSFGEEKASAIAAFVAFESKKDHADDDLFDILQEKFGAWTQADFLAADSSSLTDLRNFMLNRGVYVKSHRVAGGNQYQAMVDTIAATGRLEWPPTAAIAAGERKRMQTFDPVLQRILGPNKIDPRFILNRDDDDYAPLPHQEAISEEDDAPAQQLTRESQQPQQRRIAQVPYGNQDARFDPRLHTEPGQQHWQREMPIRTSPTVDIPAITPTTAHANGLSYTDHSGTSVADKEQKRILNIIEKQYPNDAKYSGMADSMNLRYRAQAFLKYCSQKGLAEEYVCSALPTMMASGESFDHCQDLREQIRDTTDWRTVLDGMAARFEIPAIVRSRASKWQSLTLQDVVKEMPDKPLSEAVRVVFDKLARTQRCLQPQYASPELLLNRLINVFETHPGTTRAVSLVASTAVSAESLTTTVQDFVRSDERAALLTAPTYAAEALYADRTYRRDGSSGNNYRGTGYRKQQGGGGNGNGNGSGGYNRKPFKCYICGKEGCRWSKHSEEERKANARNWQSGQPSKTAEQYLADIGEAEGDGMVSDSEDDEEDGGVNAYHAAAPGGDEDDEDGGHYTIFWGQVVKGENANGEKVVSALGERRMAHALMTRVEEVHDEDPTGDDVAFIGLSRYNNNEFMGFIVDTGAAAYSTCGKPQFHALQKLRSGIELDTSTTISVTFGAGNATSSCGSAEIETPIGPITFHVMDVDTPFLVSLKDMDDLSSYLDNTRNVMVSPDGETPVVRRFGHAFMTIAEMAHSFGASSFFTATELTRLHRRFGHPSVERLHKLLTKAGNVDVDMEELRQIREFCHNCQKHQGPPKRFKFNLREDHDVVFNGSILVDVAYIDGKPYLHVIDQATGFMAARWLDNMKAQHAWDKLRECWLDTYLGPPDVIVHDQGTNFASQEFRDNAAVMGTKTKGVPTEAHHSVGQVERYHGMVKRAYLIVTKEAPELSRESALQMAIKAINDTAGPNGIVPTLLVFGAYPRMSATATPGPTVTQRAAAIKAAIKDLEKSRAQRQLTEALRMRNGPDIEAPRLTDLVLVWREAHGSGSTATQAGWHGPYKVRAVDNEEVTVEFGNGVTGTFRSTSVRVYKTDGTPENATDAAPKRGRGRPPRVQRQEDVAIAAPKRGRGRPPRIPRQLLASACDSVQPAGAFAAMRGPGGTIWLTAPAPTPNYDHSRRLEIFGLLEKGVFEPFPRANLPHNIRLFNGRFVDEIKHAGTAHAIEKSRFVVQAHNDNGKASVLTQSPTIQRMSQRLLLCIAACRLDNGRFQLLLRDISQAYVQATTNLQRDIYVSPHPNVRELLALPDDAVLRIKKPLYGVPEAGNHWFATYTKHHVEALGMEQSAYDACLMVRKKGAFGLVGLQTDDTLILADNEFAALEEEKLHEAGFLAKPREALTTAHPLKFNGGSLQLADNGDLSLSQESQVMNISPVSNELQVNKGTRGKISEPLETKQQYVAQRARGAYVASVCQPEAAFDLSAAAQHTDPTVEEINALNERLEWQLANQKRGLRFVKLDEETVEVVVFTDAAFANNRDLSSQIGYVVVIRDASGTANIVHWSSTKCRRVTKSVLAAELYAFVQGFDVASCIKATMDNIYGREIPLVICTDSKSIFDAVTRLGVTSEKRLMIDLAMVRQAYERREIVEVKWIAGIDNPADALTKGKPCEALARLIDTNHIDLKEEVRVERP